MGKDIVNDFDLLTFKYNGSKYGIQVIIQNVSQSITIPLDNSLLDQVSYESTINNLIMTGDLYYTDVQGKLDKILGESYSVCSIYFWKERKKAEKNLQSFEIDQKEIEFKHTFLINNIYIVNRDKHKITYHLELVSINWQKMNKLVSYTNYNKEAESITDIIKNLLQQSGFQIDGESFNKYKSSINIKYITKVNDTVHSAIKYLFRRMYYDKDDGLEKSLKFLGYSIVKDKIYLINLAEKKSFLSEDIIPMSMLQNSIEDMASEEQIQMSSINKISKIEFLNSFKKRNIYKYNSEKNEIKEIKDTFLCHKNLLNNYFNGTMDDPAIGVDSLGKAIQTHKKITLPIRDAFINNQDKWQTYWNNNENIYEDMLANLMYNDTLIVSLDGNIARNPAAFLGIVIDRDQINLSVSDGTSVKEKQQKFRKFEGTWIVGRVNHVIQPNKMRYKTNLLLCRNWTTNIDPL